ARGVDSFRRVLPACLRSVAVASCDLVSSGALGVLWWVRRERMNVTPQRACADGASSGSHSDHDTVMDGDNARTSIPPWNRIAVTRWPVPSRRRPGKSAAVAKGLIHRPLPMLSATSL